MRHGTFFVCLLAMAVVGGMAPGFAAEGPNKPPEAEAGLDQTVEQGATILLDAGGSWDPDGEIAAVDWRIRAPNGSTFEPDCGSCEETSFVPERQGIYNVTVTVTDDDGATRTDTLFVTVEPASPPTVELTASVVGSGPTWRIRAEARAGNHALERLVWRVDGTRIEVESVSGEQATRQRTLDLGPNETHTVSITVADWLGNRGQDAVTVGGSGSGDAPDQQPTIQIVRAPDQLQTDQPGRFVARATDPDGGTVDLTWSPSGQSGRSVDLSWGTPGTYTVTATATDDEGSTARDEVTVLVTADSNGGGGESPQLQVDITEWPDQLEVGENGTFKAVARTATGQPLPITWDPGTKSGETVVMSWDSPGEKNVVATGTYNETYSGTDAVTVDVVEQNGPVADMTINPQCAADRDYLCGPVTGNTKDPIGFSSSSKPGGGDIVSYTWTINGSLASNQKSFSDTFSEGTYNATLTVEDEFGKTDSTNRTFEVVADGTDMQVSLSSNLTELCSDNPDDCTWDANANELTIIKDKRTTFGVSVSGLPENPDNVEWDIPWIAKGGEQGRTGLTQSITWNDYGSGTVNIRYYDRDQSGDLVEEVETISVNVIEGGNVPPNVTIEKITAICGAGGTRISDTDCTKTAGINVTYTVWDTDKTGKLTLNGHLSPEGSHPIADKTVSPYETTYTTQPIPVSADGEHQFRLTVDDTRSVSRAKDTVFIANATGGGSTGTGGVVVDGKWSMDVEIESLASGAEAATTVACETPNGSSKCPGKQVEVNWGDGSSPETLTSNYTSGSNTWDTTHVYSGDSNPTVSVVVLDQSGGAVTTMQRYLDLGTIAVFRNWKFDKYVTWNEPNPLPSPDSGTEYLDNESIEEPYGGYTWVDNTNFSIKNDDWIQVVQTRTDYYWTGQYTYGTVAPYCGDNCRWVLVERNARTVRGSLQYTDWFDTKQSGLTYELLETGENVIGSATYYVESTISDDSWYADECPTGPVTCTLTESGSGTDYRYNVYSVYNQNKYRKQTGDKDWMVQKYWTTVSERWVTVENVQ
ncbi:MAG: PKD domain-containing protein [Haloarculaceae archaeon]